MPKITVNLATHVRRSFRVEQVAGMFDVPLGERMRHELTAEVPGLEEPWTIGAIVGPSASGKTTLARAAFGDCVYQPRAWPKDRAIIDVLGECGMPSPGCPTGNHPLPKGDGLTIKLLTRGLTAVGLGSPPTWLKPYHVLSTGERFRADLLRALLAGGGRGTGDGGRGGVLVIDEFSGSLDRTIAKTTSAALARLLRARAWHHGSEAPSASAPCPPSPSLRFVAVTCHHDILPWLAPDWILELRGATHAPRLTRNKLRRPRLKLIVERVPQAMWTRFASQHYLTGGLAASATCYAAMWNREPLAFCAVAPALGWRGVKRIQRLATLPAFQGLGIGGQLLDRVAAQEAGRGFRVTITASHPAIIAHCSRSPRWQYFGLKKTGSTPQQFAGREIRSSVGRAVASFEFVR
jgi:GNAT superfamily N-acetyltransferase